MMAWAKMKLAAVIAAMVLFAVPPLALVVVKSAPATGPASRPAGMIAAPRGPLNYEVAADQTLTGLVTDSKGKPIEGATVLLGEENAGPIPLPPGMPQPPQGVRIVRFRPDLSLLQDGQRWPLLDPH